MLVFEYLEEEDKEVLVVFIFEKENVLVYCGKNVGRENWLYFYYMNGY